MKVVVLGASGQTGRQICELLLQEEQIDVVACGRRKERLTQLEAQVGGARETSSLSTAQVDVDADDGRLADVIRGADVVVGATSHWQQGPRIAELAARSGASYLGIYSSCKQKWAELRRLQDLSLEHRVAIIDDGGAHPGLPGVLVRLAAARGGLREAWVGARFQLEWSALELSPETIEGFVSEVSDIDVEAYVEGRWVKGMRHSRRFDFGGQIGAATCIPMCLEEMRELPDAVEGLTSTGFFIAGFGPVVDYLVFPVGMALGRLHRRTAARLIWWGLRTFERKGEFGIVCLDATTSDGTSIHGRIGPADPYALTAIPVVAALLQMRDKPRPGVWTQAAFVESEAFLTDLARLGLGWELSTDASQPNHAAEAGSLQR